MYRDLQQRNMRHVFLFKGTARPVRVTVLVDDEPRMPMDELEGVTNALCYAHGIVTSPISLPAHLYAAADLAKRGRNNFKTEQ